MSGSWDMNFRRRWPARKLTTATGAMATMMPTTSPRMTDRVRNSASRVSTTTPAP